MTTQYKMVDGELVELTKSEIDQRIIEQGIAEIERAGDYIKTYRDKVASIYTYKNVPMRLTDGARADLSAMYYMVLLNQGIHGNTVMMEWQESGYDPLPITAADLRDDGHLFAEHRQKCFSAAKDVLEEHEETPFTTIEAVEEAFDEAYAD